MNPSDAKRRKSHERYVIFLARIIEVRGGDDDGYADRFLREVVRQAKPNDRAIAVKKLLRCWTVFSDAVINLLSYLCTWRASRKDCARLDSDPSNLA